ncbi:hypothetical protein AU490_12130 [Lonsdalea populi]|uniref:Uncharacterized protein n=1 Tax=Lonsdalea populi TaxID=1172565 RepID=A0A3N0UTG3_9GAMM|nr:hypothetical protein AU499_12640 [Lonsdalea populi]RAT16789.1 hypothetical protein AU486_06890 [Lonsdalea quercina]RAT27267.1 hypothetical protein AU490_12130 [Lonsdalea populi]RAT30045.1 hypothetical protein AU491_16035 [Lonsdalea populi]RAT41365.1 hypothetical protein AU494_12950 [Lonsdalea populi]
MNPDQLDPRNPEDRKALRLMTVPIRNVVKALGLCPLSWRDRYTRTQLCRMAVQKGLTLRDFVFSKNT